MRSRFRESRPCLHRNRHQALTTSFYCVESKLKLIALRCAGAFDPIPNGTCRSLGTRYVELNQLFAESDIITLHCPLTPGNKYMIDKAAIARIKPGVMLINTSRGALLDTVAVIEALKSGKIGYLGLDVYEEEEQIFFEDRSGLILSDDVFARLLTFPNVIITGHQAFFTREALLNIAATTIDNITGFENNQPLEKLAG